MSTVLSVAWIARCYSSPPVVVGFSAANRPLNLRLVRMKLSLLAFTTRWGTRASFVPFCHAPRMLKIRRTYEQKRFWEEASPYTNVIFLSQFSHSLPLRAF